ncbi:hypothetical protein SAMN04515660_3577 [Luteibacter sp. 329MFSha]|nr:hypothetical protein SAMN04515660_3577 [Luteibacter sp. 329MFSha]
MSWLKAETAQSCDAPKAASLATYLIDIPLPPVASSHM